MEENWLCKRKIKEREEWAIAHFQLSVATEKVVLLSQQGVPSCDRVTCMAAPC